MRIYVFLPVLFLGTQEYRFGTQNKKEKKSVHSVYRFSEKKKTEKIGTKSVPII
jgi:hypothetical protein